MTSTTHTGTDTVRVAAQTTFSSHMEHLAAGRGQAWVDLFTEDAVLEFPYAPAGYPRRVTGHHDLLAHVKKFGESFRVEFTELHFYETVDPALVIAQLKCVGAAINTGRPYNQTYLSVVEMKDGRIDRYVDFWNPQVVTDALGAGAG